VTPSATTEPVITMMGIAPLLQQLQRAQTISSILRMFQPEMEAFNGSRILDFILKSRVFNQNFAALLFWLLQLNLKCFAL
jgi:hypothetical protein